MSHQVILPPLDGSDTFVVEHYYVAVNDEVVAGQLFALVRSEHCVWDIPATTGGVIGALLIEPGGTVVPGAVLIEIREQGSEGKEQAEQNQRLQRPSLVEEPQSEPVLLQQRVRATPVARRMIAAHGLDPAALIGTGRGKVVTRADVLAVVGNREQAPGTTPRGCPVRDLGNKEQGNTGTPDQRATKEQRAVIEETQPSTDHQSSIVNRQSSQPSNVQRSTFNVPYALTSIEVDMSTALDMIAKHEQWARRGVTISTTACVVAAAAAALGEHRLLHSTWTDDGIILRSRVHVLIEQPTSSGMRATLVPDAADLNAVGVARCLAHPAHQKESKRQPATFVITQHAAPWWTHALPDGTCTAQLGVGAIVQQPRVVATAHGDQIVVQPTMVVTLAYDARVATQPDADALLCAIKRQLEHLHSL